MGGFQDPTVIDAPAPRPDQLPMGSSRNTWPNIVNNKVLKPILARLHCSGHSSTPLCSGCVTIMSMEWMPHCLEFSLQLWKSTLLFVAVPGLLQEN